MLKNNIMNQISSFAYEVEQSVPKSFEDLDYEAQ